MKYLQIGDNAKYEVLKGRFVSCEIKGFEIEGNTGRRLKICVKFTDLTGKLITKFVDLSAVIESD